MVLPFLLSTVLIEAVLPEPRGAQRARKPNRGHAVAHEVRGGGNPAGHPGARWRQPGGSSRSAVAATRRVIPESGGGGADTKAWAFSPTVDTVMYLYGSSTY